MTENDKRFDEWNIVKKNIHFINSVPRFSEGEVYWCAFGENIGVEINGKNTPFSRPVLVYRKLSRYGFLGIPLTSQEHIGSWYVGFRFLGRKQWAVLSQIRVFSVCRLYSKIGEAENRF